MAIQKKKTPPKSRSRTKGIKNRIKELRLVSAKDLKSNPKNWRQHPTRQRKVLDAILKEVGYADAVLARETADGLVILDGHLRQEEADPNQKIPVLILDISEEEGDKILATHDPLGAMATPDPKALANLIQSIDTQQNALVDLFLGFNEASAKAIEGIQMSMESMLLSPPKPPGEEGERETPVTQTGDLWLLGEHRVLCGDSTKPEDVERLLSGEAPAVDLTGKSLPLFGTSKRHAKRLPNQNVVMYSGGKDSLAMMLVMEASGTPIDVILNVAEGWEWPEMKEHHKQVERRFRKRITFLDVSKEFEIGFEKYGFPQLFARWCNTIKMKAVEAWIRKREGKHNITQFIGIAYDERERVPRKQYASRNFSFPLVTEKVTEEDALKKCFAEGFDFGGLYKAQNRVSCWCCPLTRDGYLLDILQNRPELWEKLRSMQARSHIPFKLPYKTVYFLEHLFWCRYQREGKRKGLDLGVRKGVSSEQILEAFRKYITQESEENEIVLSCDINTDEVLVICEQLNRRCYGLETSTAYCDVIVERWQSATDKEATLEGDGRTFDEIKKKGR